MMREEIGSLTVPSNVPVLKWCVVCTMHRPILEPKANTSHREASDLNEVLGNLKIIFMKLVSFHCLMNVFMSISCLFDVKSRY